MRFYSLMLTLSLACLLNAFSMLSSESTQQDSFLSAYLALKKNVSLESNAFLSALHQSLVRARNAECIMTENGKFDESLIRTQNLPSENRSELAALFRQFPIANSSVKSEILSILNDNCYNYESLKALISLKNNENPIDIDTMAQLFVIQQLNDGCDFCPKEDLSKRPTRSEVWMYGLIFVSVINSSSLLGAVLIPFAKKQFYLKLLMFLIALAVGSLAGSGFLHLIPQAHGITEDPHYSSEHQYVWKGLVIMCGIYLFYIVERFMKILIWKKKKHSSTKLMHKEETSTAMETLQTFGYVKTHQSVDLTAEMRTKINTSELEAMNVTENNAHGHSHGDFKKNDLSLVAPVAWMIICGDGLHNFIDGLSIGVAFTESLLKGVSISVAVICEEFPHELGDFAILINSGMSFKQALLFNFISSCACYAGLVIGIITGENLKINEWIYAIAGGMFIYISLCDMIPEMHEAGDEIEQAHVRRLKIRHADDTVPVNLEKLTFLYKLKVMFIQNIGIIIGFGLMLIMARYGQHIRFE